MDKSSKLKLELSTFQDIWEGGYFTGYSTKRNQKGLEEYLRKNLEGKTLLEIGCGGGQWTKFISELDIFKKIIWIIIPISSCILSVVIMMGLLGLLGWKVTVISSNFIALMLILTMAMNIHVSTRYLQLKKNFPEIKQNKLIFMIF